MPAPRQMAPGIYLAKVMGLESSVSVAMPQPLRTKLGIVPGNYLAVCTLGPCMIFLKISDVNDVEAEVRAALKKAARITRREEL